MLFRLIFCIFWFISYKSLFALAGLQPVGESWSKDCIVALQREVSNRILRIEIQGAHEGKALVALIDEGSDPQVNVAELLTSAGFSVPAPVLAGGDHQPEQKAVTSTKQQGGNVRNWKYCCNPQNFKANLFKSITFTCRLRG